MVKPTVMHDDHFDTDTAAAYVLGTLPDGDAARLAAHAAGCAACRQRLQDEHALARRLRIGLAPLPPGQTAARLDALQPPPPRRATVGPLWQRARHALALVLLVSVLAAGVATTPAGLTPTAATPAARAALVQATASRAAAPGAAAPRQSTPANPDSRAPAAPQPPRAAPRPAVQSTPPVAAADRP